MSFTDALADAENVQKQTRILFPGLNSRYKAIAEVYWVINLREDLPTRMLKSSQLLHYNTQFHHFAYSIIIRLSLVK